MDIDIHSFQNEPGKKSWAACEWPEDTALVFLRDYLVPQLIEDGLLPVDPAQPGEIMLMADEETRWTDRPLNRLLKDEELGPHIDIAAAHPYGGGNYPSRTFDTAREMGKRVWQTEFYNKGNEGHATDTIEYGLMIARIMHNYMINNDVNAYNFWWIADSEPSGRDRDSEALIQYFNEDDTYKIQKQGYVFGQFSRFIRPGYQRIANTNPFPQLGAGVTEPIDKSVTLGVSAYTNETGNRLVVVAINDSAVTETIDLTIKNVDGSIQNLDAWRTSATENMEPIKPVSVADDLASLTLPPYSITTYVSE